MFRYVTFVLCLLISVHCLAKNSEQEAKTNKSSLNNRTLQENGRLPDQLNTNGTNKRKTDPEGNQYGNKQMQETLKRQISRSQMQDLRPQIQGTVKPQDNFRNKVIHINQEHIIKSPSKCMTEVTKNDDDDDEQGESVCFAYLGCFNMGHPWRSPLRPISAPISPAKIQTTLFFFSRQNPVDKINISLYPRINMRQAQNLFDPSKTSVIIVHGFASSGNSPWLKDMKNAYLKHVDANVMLVHWQKGACSLNYLQVAGNTRVVGKQLAIFLNHLVQNYGANPGKFHLIGHSLGAHICSYLGKEVRGIGRLTALDPAQPGFEGFNKRVRLHRTDARFVDVVHTDARPLIPFLGFGMIGPYGDVDFYMNGGFDQPGCIYPPVKDMPPVKSLADLAKYPVELLGKMVACPHARAQKYLIEAFNETEKCIFWGHKALLPNVIKTVTNTVTQAHLKKFVALSPVCSKNDCVPLGFETKKSSQRGIFVVTTARKPPYCISKPGISPEVD